jgi:hypothetical protein
MRGLREMVNRGELDGPGRRVNAKGVTPARDEPCGRDAIAQSGTPGRDGAQRRSILRLVGVRSPSERVRTGRDYGFPAGRSS